MNLLFLDCEIASCIPGDDQEEDNRLRKMYQFCAGWHDFAGMGLACVTTYSTGEARPHVYLSDNWEDLVTAIQSHDMVVTFNGDQFDIPLLGHNGIYVGSDAASFDLAAAIWEACGIERGTHPKGLGLDALCRAQRIQGKTASGWMAPMLHQDGKIGNLIDYCLGDTLALLRLWRHIFVAGGFRDPRVDMFRTLVLPR